MAFIPRLPTFQCPVDVWKYDPDTDTFEEQAEPKVGQVYTQYRNQDDNTSGTLYFEYPWEEDDLRDLKDYNDVGKADIVVIHFPTEAARDVAYMVRDVQPRWLGFVNEHIMATLVRLSPLEFETLTDPPEPPDPEDLLEQERFWPDYESVYDPDRAEWTPAGGVGSDAECTLNDTFVRSQVLNTTGPTHSIPTGAVISGIKVERGRGDDTSGGPTDLIKDQYVFLIFDGGTTVSEDKAVDVDTYPASGGYTWGGNTDLWGLAITPAMLNAGDVIFQQYSACITPPGADVPIHLSQAKVTVYYYIP